MAQTPTSSNGRTAMASKSTDSGETSKAKNSGEAEVQANVDEETAKGFSGIRTDPTPLENYTLPGKAGDLPTPETDAPDEKPPTKEDGS